MSAAATASSEQSYTFKVDGDATVTIGAFADGVGGAACRFLKTSCAVFRKKNDMGAADYNPSALTSDHIITVDTTTAARSVIISTEDRDSGSPTNVREFIINDIAGNASVHNITISLETSGTINGAATFVLNNDNDSAILMVDGTNGYVI